MALALTFPFNLILLLAFLCISTLLKRLEFHRVKTIKNIEIVTNSLKLPKVLNILEKIGSGYTVIEKKLAVCVLSLMPSGLHIR